MNIKPCATNPRAQHRDRQRDEHHPHHGDRSGTKQSMRQHPARSQPRLPDHLLGTSCAQHVWSPTCTPQPKSARRALRMVGNVMGEIPREAGDDRCLVIGHNTGAQPLGDRTVAAGRPD